MDVSGDVSSFGATSRGEPAHLVTLDDGHDLVATVTDFGATLVSLYAPDRSGRPDDVVLGFDDVRGYEDTANPYLGATIGRVANRIAFATFELDGQRYELAANEAPHHLHGGATRSFDKVRWTIESASPAEVTLRYVARDGEEGYPGELDVRASYRLDRDALVVGYEARTDRPTPVSLTTHSYWNLAAGARDVHGHELEIVADRYTPTDATLIPTGEIAEVAGTPLDLRVARPVRALMDELETTPAGGLDHNYVLGPTDRDGLRPAARVVEPRSGRVLDVRTNQPGLQVYSGHKIPDGLTGKRGAVYGPFAGLCLEPQQFPDAVHHPTFPPVVLRPGEVHHHRSRYRLRTAS